MEISKQGRSCGMRPCLYGLVLLAGAFFAGCNSGTVYKAQESVRDGQWYADYTPSFKVDIQDTASKYNVYYLLRNTLHYPYYNLYLTRTLKGPDQRIISSKLVELMISDEVTGKPYGKGLGDLFDHKILLLKNYTFPQSGVYTFTIAQSMRQNPLPFILSIGICVEKVADR